MPVPDKPWTSLCYVSLIDDCYGRDQLMVGDATPGLLVLGSISKQSE